MYKIIVSVFYIGFIPFAPGTFGSFFGVVMGFFIQVLWGLPILAVSTAVFFLLGWHSTQQYISNKPSIHDPQEIVIDEVVGQWVSYLPFSFYLWFFTSENFLITWYGWPAAFISFRMFDIWKPWPVILADKMKSSLGVMLDDLLAGIYAALLMILLIVIILSGKV